MTVYFPSEIFMKIHPQIPD